MNSIHLYWFMAQSMCTLQVAVVVLGCVLNGPTLPGEGRAPPKVHPNPPGRSIFQCLNNFSCGVSDRMIVNVEDPIICIVYSCVRSNHAE